MKIIEWRNFGNGDDERKKIVAIVERDDDQKRNITPGGGRFIFKDWSIEVAISENDQYALLILDKQHYNIGLPSGKYLFSESKEFCNTEELKQVLATYAFNLNIVNSVLAWYGNE